jgi:hypothetical protein
MTPHPAAKVLALVKAIKTTMEYARHKEPATLEDARRMLRLIAAACEETIEEEAAA